MLAKMPNAAAPDPDMRANRQSGSRISAFAGSSGRLAHLRGRLGQVVPRLAQPEDHLEQRAQISSAAAADGVPPSASSLAKYRCRRNRDAGICEHNRHRRHPGHRRDPLADSLGDQRLRRLGTWAHRRQVGARSRASASSPSCKRHSRLRSRSVAAASADPPPSPAATGMRLVSDQFCRRQLALPAVRGAHQFAGRADGEIFIGRRIGELGGERPLDRQAHAPVRRGVAR